MEALWGIFMVAVVIIIGLMLFRVFQGPTIYDRMNGLGVIGADTILLLVLFGYMDGRPDMYVDIAISYQKAQLFKGTVRSNLIWGNENATEDMMWAALEAAQAKDFIEDKGGLDATVMQNGSNFSGGQRQRLTVARALIKHAPILILDDSASALDYATEAKLRRTIASLEYSPTVFIVSQRAESVAECDKILVLDAGAAVGLGTHSELYESCIVYREICDSQKGGESR